MMKLLELRRSTYLTSLQSLVVRRGSGTVLRNHRRIAQSHICVLRQWSFLRISKAHALEAIIFIVAREKQVLEALTFSHRPPQCRHRSGGLSHGTHGMPRNLFTCEIEESKFPPALLQIDHVKLP